MGQQPTAPLNEYKNSTVNRELHPILFFGSRVILKWVDGFTAFPTVFCYFSRYSLTAVSLSRGVGAKRVVFLPHRWQRGCLAQALPCLSFWSVPSRNFCGSSLMVLRLCTVGTRGVESSGLKPFRHAHHPRVCCGIQDESAS